MTEIPEHLLKRSKAAKAAASGESAPEADAGDAGTAVEPAAAAPAPVAAATVPEVVAEPEPARVANYVHAANERKKMPFWIAPVLLALPVWAMMYVGTLERVPQGLTGLLGEGEEIYVEAGCSGCHGAEGGGGIGPALSDGEPHLTFTSIEDQVVWIAKGSTLVGTGVTYSSADSPRPRAVAGGMPGFGAEAANSLDAEEILAVTLYERTQFEPGDVATEDLAVAAALTELLETGEIDLQIDFDGATLTAADVASWLAPAREAVAAEG
ncbi:MAG: c-type cytochrome [Acidimicrobiales bacterium]|nr:c-type cytochrome [Acidimicrobiales bacterium]RZV47931.1 MAG: c-type cytochrome [Acidimicrobiales bacterium]